MFINKRMSNDILIRFIIIYSVICIPADSCNEPKIAGNRMIQTTEFVKSSVFCSFNKQHCFV